LEEKMKKKVLAALFCIMLTLTATLAWADIRSEIASQQHRIRQGIRSGELTRHETRALEENLIDIERQYRRASRDGYISPREEDRLYRELEINSQKIYRLKHNDRARY
jgi:hypothetical protein